MTTSTIFFAHQNCIDFGYIRRDGAPIGFSVNPSFTLTGRIEEKEQVVIDFSDSKKKLKEFMDASFDHRLVVFRCKDGSLSGVEIAETDARNRTTFHLKNGLGSITVPEDAFVIVDTHDSVLDVSESDFVQGNLQIFLTQYCEAAMEKHYGFPVKVGVKMATYMMSFGDLWECSMDAISFQYVHGLKNSTSYGCKNIAHGHLSYLHFQKDMNVPMEDFASVGAEYHQLTQRLTNCIFINKDNLTTQGAPNEQFDVISYSTEQRGFMEMALNTAALAEIKDVNIHVCEKETTIENLAEYVSLLIAKEFPNLSAFATEMYISEGLTKGCLYDRRDHIKQHNAKAA
ncbi:hypothetical protein [Yersinia ruckeri]|uniref:hypothetical protein n=1 Tax=Yersinia ruckeri TaxID=29486 RepID=UPI002237E390|nr:hypothetical protein [Yersinia ruckeri]MCW6598649.1 hypothetical protein [Yersinia ruckeri]